MALPILYWMLECGQCGSRRVVQAKYPELAWYGCPMSCTGPMRVLASVFTPDGEEMWLAEPHQPQRMTSQHREEWERLIREWNGPSADGDRLRVAAAYEAQRRDLEHRRESAQLARERNARALTINSRSLAYSAVVQDGNEREWRLRPFGDLVGLASPEAFGQDPSLSISDAEPPARSSGERPWVLRSRLTLRGGSRQAFFHVDRSVVAALRPGDVVHVAQRERGGLGFSVVRNGDLVLAVGAVSIVPLGDGVRARVAPELWAAAIAGAETRADEGEDPHDEYEYEWPVEIGISSATYLFFRRNETIQGIHVFVKHGFQTHPERDECVALCRVGHCPVVGATASAFLLAVDGLEAGHA